MNIAHLCTLLYAALHTTAHYFIQQYTAHHCKLKNAGYSRLLYTPPLHAAYNLTQHCTPLHKQPNIILTIQYIGFTIHHYTSKPITPTPATEGQVTKISVFLFVLFFYNIWQTVKRILVFFSMCYAQGACHHFFMSAAEIPEIVKLVINMQLLAISSMSEVRSEHKVCFRLP